MYGGPAPASGPLPPRRPGPGPGRHPGQPGGSPGPPGLGGGGGGLHRPPGHPGGARRPCRPPPHGRPGQGSPPRRRPGDRPELRPPADGDPSVVSGPGDAGGGGGRPHGRGDSGRLSLRDGGGGGGHPLPPCPGPGGHGPDGGPGGRAPAGGVHGHGGGRQPRRGSGQARGHHPLFRPAHPAHPPPAHPPVLRLCRRGGGLGGSGQRRAQASGGPYQMGRYHPALGGPPGLPLLPEPHRSHRRGSRRGHGEGGQVHHLQPGPRGGRGDLGHGGDPPGRGRRSPQRHRGLRNAGGGRDLRGALPEPGGPLHPLQGDCRRGRHRRGRAPPSLWCWP